MLVSGLYMIGCGTGKIIWKYLPFLQFEQVISRAGKFKVMLHFRATEMCLFVFLFSFEFPDLEVLFSKFKKGGNYKIIFSTPYPSIYYPGSY